MKDLIVMDLQTIIIITSVLILLVASSVWFIFNLPEFLIDDIINLVVKRNQAANLFAVSYTHLTLPTNREV